MDSSRTGRFGLRLDEREELQGLRADDRSCEAQGRAPAAEKIARRLELDARERAAEAQGRLLDAMRGLRTLRVVLGLGLAAVADGAGLEHVRLVEIERGVGEIATDDEIRAVCGALGSV